MDKNILNKSVLESQKFKESGSSPGDLKINSQVKERKGLRGTVETRDLSGSQRGVLVVIRAVHPRYPIISSL